MIKTHNEPTLDTFNKATQHIFKGNHPFSFCFLMLVFNLCVCVCACVHASQLFCKAGKKKVFSQLKRGKKREAFNCVFSRNLFLSCLIPPRILLVSVGVSSVSDLYLSHLSLVFAEEHDVSFFVSLGEMKRDA